MPYVLTLVASKNTHPVSQKHINEIHALLKSQNVQINSDPTWLSENKAVDLTLFQNLEIKIIHNLQKFLHADAIDIFITTTKNRRKRLLMADMDSTIVEGETLDELADFAGLKNKIATITAKAMEGEIDFHTALNERVALLKGLSTDALEKTLSATQINPGAKTLIQTMKNHGAFCVLVSGGFTYFTEKIAHEIGFNDNHGNTLEIKNDLLTGKVIPPILDKAAKIDFLNKHTTHLNIHSNDVMAIGDGANDLPMLELAGFGVGYKPKGIVAQTIPNTIIHGDFTAALYAQGYTEQDIEK